ncbi:MAG: sensor hybrid histidine kinase, partial [Verrucomicrobiales bacterium]|nr:sensor hybrid histidine kinase [Verrucomicrobiales bacterium]
MPQPVPPKTQVAKVAMNITLQGIRSIQTGTICLLLAFFYFVGGETALRAEPKPLLFLADRDYPPMAFLEEGKAMGMDIDLAKALAREMHREIRIELMDWGEAQQRLSKGEADGLLGMSITRERRTRYNFASPVFNREFGLLIRKGDETIHGISDLRGKTVGVTQGGFPKEFLESRTGFQLRPISNYQEGFDRLGKGELNAVAGDLWVAAYLLEQKNIRNITIVERPMARVPAAIALQKGNTELLHDIDKALQLLKENGTISNIQSYWKPQEIVFISREKVRNLIALSAGGLALLLFAGMSLWVVTLKKQIRIRKITEGALKNSEKRLQMLTDASFEGIGLCEDGILIDANDQLLKMVGYARTEIIGKPVMQLIAPESRALVQQKTESRCTDAYEHFAIRKDGSIFPVEVCGRTLETSPKDVRVTAVRDISERKEAEKALLLSEQRFGAVFQQSPVALAVSEFETGRFIEINAALLRLMRGRSFDQMVNRTSLEIGMITTDERRKIIDAGLKLGGGERLEVAMHRL